MYSNQVNNHGCHGCHGHHRHGCHGCHGCHEHHHHGCRKKKVNCHSKPIIAVDKECDHHHHQPHVFPKQGGSIIPCASRDTNLKSKTNGDPDNLVFVGFGQDEDDQFTNFSNTLNLSGKPDTAFTMPRAGYLTDFSATFTSLEDKSFSGKTITVHATVYRADKDSNMFHATNAKIDLNPTYTGSIDEGDMAIGTANFSPIPLSVGERILVVFYMTSNAQNTSIDIDCKLGAGLTIL